MFGGGPVPHGFGGDVEFGSKAAFRSRQTLIDRSCALLFIYTADVHRYYDYADQFRDMYRGLNFKGLVEYEYAADADHLFSLPGRRGRLMKRVGDWKESRFGV